MFEKQIVEVIKVVKKRDLWLVSDSEDYGGP